MFGYLVSGLFNKLLLIYHNYTCPRTLTKVDTALKKWKQFFHNIYQAIIFFLVSLVFSLTRTVLVVIEYFKPKKIYMEKIYRKHCWLQMDS